MLKPNITTRRFYNKWIYKATLNLPGVAIFRMYKLENIPLLDFSIKTNTYSTMSKAAANKHDIIRLSYFLVNWDNALWAKRIENSSIDIYTNSKEMYNSILGEFEDFIYSCFEPDEKNIDILNNTGSVVVKKLPHDKYQFKVFLLPHKIKSREEKHEYLSWIDGQGDKILISKVVKDWFIKTEWNWDRRYLLVEDSQTLLMLKLRNAQVLGRIYDYVICDK